MRFELLLLRIRRWIYRKIAPKELIALVGVRNKTGEKNGVLLEAVTKDGYNFSWGAATLIFTERYLTDLNCYECNGVKHHTARGHTRVVASVLPNDQNSEM